jgi:hypothetical protein
VPLVTEIRPLQVADTHGEGATGPVYAYALFLDDGLILVDTGMIDLGLRQSSSRVAPATPSGLCRLFRCPTR